MNKTSLIFIVIVVSGAQMPSVVKCSQSDERPNNNAGSSPCVPQPGAACPRPPYLELESFQNGELEKEGFKMSYDGRYAAWIETSLLGRDLNVQLLDDLVARNATSRAVTLGYFIGLFEWAYQSNVMIFVSVMNAAAHEYDVYKVDITPALKDGKQEGTITKLAVVTGAEAALVNGGLSALRADTAVFVVRKQEQKFFDLYEFNIDTGEQTLIVNNTVDDRFTYFYVDNNLTLRLAAKMDEKGNTEYCRPIAWSASLVTGWASYKNVPFASRTHKIKEHEPFDWEAITEPIGFDQTNEHVYWKDNEHSDLALVLRPFDEPSVARQVIFAPKIGEINTPSNVHGMPKISSVYMHPTEYRPIAVVEYYSKPVLKVLDQAYADDYAKIQKFAGNDGVALPIFHSLATRLFPDMCIMLFYVFYDNRQPSVYAYDADAKKVQYVYTPYPQNAKMNFSHRRPVEVETRDGYTMVCYLTTPEEHDLGDGNTTRPISMLVDVHGGPWLRNHWWMFYKYPRWFANRGVAFLQCNFRGSAGFGKKWLHAGDGELGRKMQYDVLDAVQWAIDRKIAHPDRVAISGWSHGGHAAQHFLAVMPDLFACGITNNGFSNVSAQLLHLRDIWPQHWTRLVKRMAGGKSPDSDEGKRFFDERSPLSHAENISRPIFIAASDNDRIVPVDQSERLASVLEELSIPFTYIVLGNADHTAVPEYNMLFLNDRTDAFLSQCLGEDYRYEEGLVYADWAKERKCWMVGANFTCETEYH